MSIGRRRGATTAPALGAPTQPLAGARGPAQFDIVLLVGRDANQLTVNFWQGGICLPACTAAIAIARPSQRQLSPTAPHPAWFDWQLGQLVASLTRIPGVYRGVIEPLCIRLVADKSITLSTSAAQDVANALAVYFGGRNRVACRYLWQTAKQDLPPLGWPY